MTATECVRSQGVGAVVQSACVWLVGLVGLVAFPAIAVAQGAEINPVVWSYTAEDDPTRIISAEEALTTALTAEQWLAATPAQQGQYLADRIGLDPLASATANGTIGSQLNWLKEQGADHDARLRSVEYGVRLSAALGQVYIPAGKRGGFAATVAAYNDQPAYSFGLASITGTRGFISVQVAVADVDIGERWETLSRFTYGISW